VALARKDVADAHARDLPLVKQDHLRGAQIALGDSPLEVGADVPYAIRAR
jgi:hypothetical protein